MTDLDVLVRVMPTPNPQALKFVANQAFKRTGKATFSSPEEAEGFKLLEELFRLTSVRQLYLFENVLTVTFSDDVDPFDFSDEVISIIKTRLPVHNPEFQLEAEKKKDRSHLSPELQEIEAILDKTIRPGLQGDGGDIEVVHYDPESKTLEVLYQGACGSCPSSMFGTLEAIRGILQEEFDPQIDIAISDAAYPY
jgi:Fe-S cluster biogenesis protein NfuA